MTPRRLAIAALLLVLAGPVLSQEPIPPASALRDIESKLKRDPANPALYVKLGLAYWDANDYAHALAAFQHAVRAGPSSAEAHNWLGVAILEKADLPGAIAEFRRAVALDPKNAHALTNLGSALAKSGDINGAVEVFQKALALEPNSLPAHMNLGVALREKGDADTALAHIRLVAKAEPNNAQVEYQLAQTLRQKGDNPGAIETFEKAVQIDPELREGYYGLGLALKKESASQPQSAAPQESPADALFKQAQESAARGDLEAAKTQLIQALQLDDQNGDAHNLLGFILGQQRELTPALMHLERAVALQPDSAAAHYNFGVALWYSGAREKAISALQRSVQLDPAQGTSDAFLGMVLRQTGDLNGAQRSLQHAVALLPPMQAVYVDLAIVFLGKGELDHALGQLEAGLSASAPAIPIPDWDSAIAGLRELLAKNPGRADAHNMMGLLLGRKGASTDAVLAEFREAVRLRPDFAEAYNNIGLVLTQIDDDAAAIKAFHEALRLKPDFADAHANLGAALIPTDDEQAIVELEKAVSLVPDLVKARFNLAAAYEASPSHGSAKQIEQLQKVIAAAPDFPGAHLALGKSLLKEGKLTESITELRAATRLAPQSGESHYQLGLALARAGQKDDAAMEVKKGRELASLEERRQNVVLDINEGRGALDKGEIEQAAAKFQHAIKLDSESADAHRYLGTVLERQGDVNGAAAAYRQAVKLNPNDAESAQNLNRLTHIAAREDDSASIAKVENYIRDGAFKEAEPLLADYVTMHPKSAWGWYSLGYSQFAQKKIGQSIQSLAKSLQLDIKNAEAHKILGRDLMIIGRFDAAQTEFEQGIRYSPRSAEIYYNLGKLFSIQDNWSAARKEFEDALRLDASYIEDLDALGLAQEALGDDPGAVASYQRAIAINEQRKGRFAGAHINLSAYYNRVGDSAKAQEYARTAIELDPGSDRAWFQKARADERQGHLQDAVDSINHAISLNSHASSYYYVLAGLDRRLGKKEESREALEMFTRLDRETNELEKKRRTSDSSAKRISSETGAERD